LGAFLKPSPVFSPSLFDFVVFFLFSLPPFIFGSLKAATSTSCEPDNDYHSRLTAASLNRPAFDILTCELLAFPYARWAIIWRAGLGLGGWEFMGVQAALDGSSGHIITYT